MSQTTGPILAAGGVVWFNAVIVQGGRVNSEVQGGAIPTSVLIGTGIAAMGLSLWEHAMPATATAFSWLILLTVLLVRVDPAVPSPLESFAQWYQGANR